LNPSKWQFLGYISNSKPSAIFRISQLKKLHELEQHETMMQFGGGDAEINHIAQIGISIEPEINVAQQTPATTSDSPSTLYAFGQKMLENFMNFASSFSLTQAQMVPNPTETYVPLSTLSTSEKSK
jgi:protein Hikeshi